MAVIALGLQTLNYVGYALAGSIAVIAVTGFIGGILNMFVTTLPISVLINNWFGSKIRGRAWGITMVGSGVGSMVLSPVVGVIIENWGWRFGYGFFGLLSVALIPLVLLTFVRHPQDKGLAIIGEPTATTQAHKKPAITGIPAKNALRSGMFWVLTIAVVLLGGSIHSWSVNGSAYLSDQGFDTIQVSFLLSISSVGLIIGKVLLGTICDKKGTKYGVLFSGGIFALGLFMSFFLGSLPWLAYPLVVLLGIGLATSTVTVPLMTRDLFGIREYSVIAGFTESGLKLGGALVPLGVSLVYDFSGSYKPAWVTIIAFCVAAITLVFTAYKMRPKAMEKYEAAEHTIGVPAPSV